MNALFTQTLKKICLLSICLLGLLVPFSAQSQITQTIDPGSVIIDMGVFPQTYGNAKAKDNPSVKEGLQYLLHSVHGVYSPFHIFSNSHKLINYSVFGENHHLLNDFFQNENYLELAKELFPGSGKIDEQWMNNAIQLRERFLKGEVYIKVNILPSADMHHLMAAFAGNADNKEASQIFLNEHYLQNREASFNLRLLTEETGHWIDYQLNGEDDTPGDEGAAFAHKILGLTPTESEISNPHDGNDHIRLAIYGQEYELELASLLFSLQRGYISNNTTLEQNSFNLNTALGVAGSRYLFISDPDFVSLFSGNNVRGTFYVVDPAPSNIITAEYFGEISRLIKTGSRVDALQFYVYPPGAPPASNSALSQTLIIPVVPSSTRTFAIGQNVKSSSDPVDKFLNRLILAPQPVVRNPSLQDALEAGGVNNGTPGSDPDGHVFEDGDVENLFVDYSIDLTTNLPLGVMVTTYGKNMVVQSATNYLNVIALVGVPLPGQYGTLTINADGSYEYILDNTNPAVEALRTSSNTLKDLFTYRVVDGTAFTVNRMEITIIGQNDNPIGNDDFNTAKESIEALVANQYGPGDIFGRRAVGNVLPNDTDVDRYSETKKVVRVIGAATFGSKANQTVYTIEFAVGTNFTPADGSFVYVLAGGNWQSVMRVGGTAGDHITTVGQYNPITRRITVNDNPTRRTNAAAYTAGVVLDLTATPTIGFSTTQEARTAAGNISHQGTATSVVTLTTTTLTGLSLIKGTVAIGMLVEGTGVPADTRVLDVIYTGANITSIVLDKNITTADNSELKFSALVPSTIQGRHGFLALAVDGSYTYTPIANNPNLNAGQSWTEQFYYIMSDQLDAPSQGFVGGPSFRTDATFAFPDPAILHITVTGSGATDPNAVDDVATAVEAWGTLNGTPGTDPSAAAPGLLGNDTTPGGTGTLSIISAQSASSSTVVTIPGSGSETIPGLYGSLLLGSNGSYTYTLDNNLPIVQALRNSSQTLVETFIYTVQNSIALLTDAATFTITIEGRNDAPVAENDFATALEAGGFLNDVEGVDPTGNLLDNDTDVDDLPSELVVTEIRVGDVEGSGVAGTVGTGSTLGAPLDGLYGSLQVAEDGSWLYTVDNTNVTVNALAAGDVLTDYFNYRVNDRGNVAETLFDRAVLEITIVGADDEIRVNDVFVNEGSPFAVFEVGALTGTAITLTLGDVEATEGDDFGSALQVWNGSEWVAYTAGFIVPTGNLLYVRVPIINDDFYEGDESFTLTASSTGFISGEGTGTINDEGEGDYWIGTSLQPADEAALIAASIVLDDDRITAVPDIGVGFIGDAITGNVSTNDIFKAGTTFDDFVADAGNPDGTLPVFGANGAYTFTATLAGTYTFTYDICPPGGPPSSCVEGVLTITVIDPTDPDSPPIANTDNYVVIAGGSLSGDVLANDFNLSTGDNTGLTVTELNGAPLAPLSIAGGTLTLLADGSFTLVDIDTPGEYSFTYTVSDGVNTSEATVYFTVYPAGSANVVLAGDDYNTTTQGSTATGNLLANDSQLDGSTALSIVSTDPLNPADPFTLTDASGNTLLINPATGIYTFTPAPNFTGSTSFVYEAVGTGGATASGTIYFTVFPNLDVNPDIAVAFLDETISGSVATNDNVPAGSTYTNLTGQLTGATLTLAADGSYDFEATVAGVYTYDIEVCAPTTPPGCETVTLTITVIDPLDASSDPVANTDNYVVLEGEDLTGNVLDNDINLTTGSSAGLTVTELNGVAGDVGVAQPDYDGSGGTLTLNSDGTFTLTGATVPGEYSFTYTVSDGVNTSEATVYFTVYPVGSANVVLAADDYNTTTSGSTATGNLLANDSQLDGSTALFIPAAGVGTFAIAGGSIDVAMNGTYTFTPDPTFSGSTSYVYTVEGTGGATASGTIYFTVFPLTGQVNPDVAIAFVGETINGSVATNDDVPTGSTFTLIGGTTTELTAFDPATGEYTFTGGAAGVYTYTIEVCPPSIPSGSPACETTTLTITVMAADATNAPPVANTDFGVGYQDSPVTLNTLANDASGTAGVALVPSSVTIVSGTEPDPLTEGALAVDPLTGDITFTPVAGFTGTVTYTYSVCDTNTPQACAQGIQTITIYPTGVNNVVAAADDYALTYQGASVSGNVLTNDTQLKAGTLEATPQTTTLAGVGTFTLLDIGSYTFEPDPAFIGNTSFVYEVKGEDGVIAFATVYFTVAETPTYTWIGGVSNDWCDPANWDKGTVPTTAVNIRILNSASDPKVEYDGACPVCINNLEMESDAELTLTANLCVTGDVTSEGLIEGSGRIVLSGTAVQNISGEFSIQNLELNNPAGAVITTGSDNMVNLTGELLLTEGFLTTNTNLTLKSSSSGSGYLGPIADCDDAGLIGNVRVEVFVEGQNRAFRFFGNFFTHPISLNQLRNTIDITGDGLDYNSSGNPSAFWYNTSLGDQRSDVDAEDIGWIPFTASTIDNWARYQGIRVMVRGPKGQANTLIDTAYVPEPVVFTWIGQLNTCEKTVYLTWSGAPGGGAAGDSKWNLVANPFAAPLDMGTVALPDRNTAGSSFYVWEPRRPYASGSTSTFSGYGPGAGRAGRYRAVPFNSGNVQERTLPIGSAFFITSEYNTVNPGAPTPNTSGSITFRENQKLRSTTPGFAQPDAGSLFRTEEINSHYGENSLQLLITEGENELDRVIVMFKETAKGTLEYWDGTKMANEDMNFFTVSKDDWALAVDSRPWEEGERFPLHILAPNGNFKVTTPDYAMEAGRVVQLYDRHLDKLITLEKGVTYQFEVTADQATKGHRFDIVMGVKVVTSIGKIEDRFQAFLLPNPAQQQVLVSIQRPDEIADTHIRLLDVRGVVLYQSSIKADDDAQINYEVGSLAKGVYLVEIIHGKQRIVKRLIVN